MMPGSGAIARTGVDYLAALDDDRYVSIDGRRISTVGGDPPFAAPAQTVANILDLHHQPANRSMMNVRQAGFAEPISRYYSLAADCEEVSLRGRCFETVARATGGLMGRSPDFLATLLASWNAAGSFFGRHDAVYKRNVKTYYEHCAGRALCHTHAISDPPSDRLRSEDGTSLALRRIDSTPDGIVVRGMKMLATLAPLADELLVYPFRPLKPGEGDHALALAVPIDTPGLRIVCRPALNQGRSAADEPLATRFDEMDAVCIFDDVLVPQERVFINGDVELANEIRSGTGMTSYLWHQSSIRAAVKAELLLGAASLVASANGRRTDPSTQEKLGEMGALVESLRCLAATAEAGARQDRFGFYVPAWSPLAASGVLYSQLYPRLVELLQLIGSSSLIMHPAEGDLVGPDAADLCNYLGIDGTTMDRVAIQKLASELAVSSFAGRQLLYERFYLGPPEVVRRRYYQESDLGSAEQMAASLLVKPASRSLGIAGGDRSPTS